MPFCNVGVLWPNGWMDQDAISYRCIANWPGDIVLDGDPTPPRKGTQAQFVYAVSAIFLLPVSAYALVGRRLSPFLQSLAPDIASLDRYGLI